MEPRKCCMLCVYYCFIALFCTSGIYSYQDTSDKDCILDHDGTNPILDQCLDRGHQFIRNYLRTLRKNTLLTFNVCFEFSAFGNCIRSLWQKCPTVRQVTDKHWTPIVNLLTSACNLTDVKYAFHHEKQCLENEMTGPLVHRCDELYEVNTEQKTRDKCVFLKESILCKTSLVNTACGHNVGEVVYSMAKINAKKLIEKARCYITQEEPYSGFQYDKWCQRDFKDDMHDCYEEHLQPHQLSFFEDNDLVVNKGKREMRHACGALRKYRACVKPIKQECKEGVEQLYEQNGTLRVYLLKMDFICREEKEVYMEKLGCLQEVVHNKSLGVCEHLWSDLKPFLKSVTSYQFYCEPHNKKTMEMQQVLENLRYCYERMFSIKCEAKTGSVMSELIRRAFADPLYLRYIYKVDCSFHTATKKRSKPHSHHQYRHTEGRGPDHARKNQALVHTQKPPPGNIFQEDMGEIEGLNSAAGTIRATYSLLWTVLAVCYCCLVNSDRLLLVKR